MPAAKKPSVKKVPVKKAVPKKAPVKKVPVKKAAPKKAPVKKVPVKKAAPKKAPVKKVAPKRSPVKVKKTAPKKAVEKSERVEDLVTQREMDVKPIEEYMGMKTKTRGDKPIIPGVFDLLIPPGTPQKIVLKMARDYKVDVVQRDDIYVPIGVSDVEREILAFRGDEKTVLKLEKILLKELKEFEKTGKVAGYSALH